MKKKLIILSGPTAAGKTALSIGLAKKINGEIISADSMQVYKNMDIGTAKIMPDEMGGICHHLIDCIEPFDEWSVQRFQELSYRAMDGIYERGHIPIIVGGTGFYVQSVLYGIDFTSQDDNTAIREELTQFVNKNGPKALHEMLEKIDEESARQIHENNIKRTIRAIEFYRLTGQKISQHNDEQHQKESPYDFVYFVLDMPREKLYERIDKRVDKMMSDGLVSEVKKLMDMGLTREHVSMKGLGYKEIIAYLEGETTLEEAVYTIKRDTRRFAKRQLTWFRRESDITWIEKDNYRDEEEILAYMLKKLCEVGING